MARRDKSPSLQKALIRYYSDATGNDIQVLRVESDTSITLPS